MTTAELLNLIMQVATQTPIQAGGVMPTPALPDGATRVLSQLADIHLSPPVSWWPPAPGWWVLAFVALIALWFALQLLRKLKRSTHARRQLQQRRQALLSQLHTLQRQWQQQRNPVLSAAALSVFLRQLVVNHQPREQVAAMSDQQWLSFIQKNILSATLTDTGKLDKLLLSLPYQDPLGNLPEDSGINALIDEIFSHIARWIDRELA